MAQQFDDAGPAMQYLAPEKVISEMAHVGAERAVGRSWPEVLLLRRWPVRSSPQARCSAR